MLPASETIYIQKGTFGTRLEFRLYSGETMEDLSASSYDQIMVKAVSVDGNIRFSGDVDETLSEVSGNEINYTLLEKDTARPGVYYLKLELINKSGSDVTSKEILAAGKIKIEE